MQQNQKQQRDFKLLIEVKQQLDERRIQGNCSPDSAALVAKLLEKISKLEEQLQGKNVDSTLQYTRNQHEDALSYELSNATTENNKLRKEIFFLKDQLEEQKMKIKEICGQAFSKINQQKSLGLVLRDYKTREEQLREELTQTVYKYNELMDLIHQDPHKERPYIKRLLKHKRITFKDNGEIASMPEIRVQNLVQKQFVQKISLLEAQLLSRNAEIQRLHSLLVDECGQVAARKWQQHQQKMKIALLKDEISALQSENDRLLKLQGDKQKTLLKTDQTRKRNVSSQSKSKDAKIKFLSSYQTAKQKNQSENDDSLDQHNRESSEYKYLQSKKSGTLREGKDNKKKTAINEYYLGVDAARMTNIKGRQKDHLQEKQQKLSQNISQNKNSKPKQKNQLLSNQVIRKHLKNPQTNSHQTASNNTTEHQGTHIKQGQQKSQPSTFDQPPRPHHWKSEKQKKHSSSFEQNEKQYYQRQLRQKEERIAELKQMLKLSPAKVSKIINKTQNITSHQTQLNNVVVNQQRNQFINISPRQQSFSQKKRISQLEEELEEIVKQRNQLQQKLKKENEKQSAKKPNNQTSQPIQEEKNNTIEAEKEQYETALKIERERRLDGEQRLRRLQQKLISVNKQNIELQNRLNNALKLIQKKPQNLPERANSAQKLQMQQNDSELERLRREVKRLKRQLQVFRTQKDVMKKQLSDTELHLQNQSREMIRFQKSVGKKYREISLSP